MPSAESDIYRELGAITTHLGNVDSKLGELVEQAKVTNGRVRQQEVDLAVLKDRQERAQEENAGLHERLKEVEGRGRVWVLGIGGPVTAALLTVLLHG